jgi:hypothetical protein
MKSPGSTVLPSTSMSSSTVTSSCMITASAPTGIGAPVKIRSASQPRRLIRGRFPPAARRLFQPSPGEHELATTAYPSIAELSNGGSDKRATMSFATKQFSASASGTLSRRQRPDVR